MAKRKTTKRIMLEHLDMLLVIIVIIAVLVGLTGYMARRTYNNDVANEHFTKPDTYKMAEYSEENSDNVLDAMKAGDAEELADLMVDKDTDVNALLDYADWSKMDIKKNTSLGGGSYMSEPDSDGKMDFGEVYWIKVGGNTYVLYIQTLTSRWGKANDGVQCVAVTTWEHYDAIDWSWEWQEDTSTTRIGTPYPGY